MASIYWMIAVFCILFYLIYSWKEKEQYIYTARRCVFWYIITRICIVLASPNPILRMLPCIAFELLLCNIIYELLHKKLGETRVRELIIKYVFWPGGMICIASCGWWRIIYICILFLVLAAMLYWKSKRNLRVEDFFFEYVLTAVAVWLFFYSRDVLVQRINQIWNVYENVPMVLILGCLVMAATLVGIIVRKDKIIDVECNESGTQCIQKDDLRQVPEKEAYKKKISVSYVDAAIMSAGTVLFLVLALFRLGTIHVPSSEMHIQSGKNDEVILDFGEDTTISRVEFFLGYESKKLVSFSVPDNGQWNVFKSKQELASVYNWNKVELNSTQRYLACKFLDSEAYVIEMVCFDENGQKVIPDNSSEYPELFDEQNLYPENMTYYYRTMFDEVYHGRTAYEFLHKLPIYENTHPPLGKIIISIGIAIFGMNPFGWRFMGVICGALIIPVIYMFALRLTGKTKFAVLAMILSLTEFMHFVLARIATLDIIAALFIILLFYLMYAFIQTEKRYYLVLDGITAGIAMAVKWNGVYAVAALALIFAFWCYGKYNVEKHGREYLGYWCRLCGVCIISFIIIPICIYVLSYIPFARVYTDKNILQHAVSNAQLMFSYHKKTIFYHPYSSEWYEWIWDKRPLLDALTVNKDGTVSSIATLGGPVVCWGGLAALIHQLYLWSAKKSVHSRFLVLCYAATLVPWMFIFRTVFIYHYLPCLNVLVLMITYSLYSLNSKKENRYIICIIVVSAALFVMFYPVLSGMNISMEYINDILEWLPDWAFA